MLALCLMLLATYYALNYAGIIGRYLGGGGWERCGKHNVVKNSTREVTMNYYM